MNPTGHMAHFNNGSNSVLGLPIFKDDAGMEFVHYLKQWVHIDEVPLQKLHRAAITSSHAAPRRQPQTFVRAVTETPNLPAFATTESVLRMKGQSGYVEPLK